MMHKTLLLLWILSMSLSTLAKHKPTYRIFNKNGNRSSFNELIRKTNKHQLIMFGEIHNNPIAHWLQLELTETVANKHSVVMGTEMIETDNQVYIDQYLSGEIGHKQLDSLARLPSNYKTDYKPLVDFAKENNIDFNCTNIPRRYASQVYRKGLESLNDLSDSIKAFMAPLPIAYDSTLSGYKNMLKMMRGRGHSGHNFPKAQAIKDATMAHFILKSFKEDHKYIHYHGTYHSDHFQGIVWYVKQHNTTLKLITISTVLQEDLKKLETEHIGKADYILVVDEDMTTTY